MNGLASRNTDSVGEKLTKTAGEGSVENNVKQLITDEAYSQIATKFPKLVPIIAGINIVEMLDDSTAIGAAVLSVEGKKLLIPIVYSEGNVDATTFIYSEDDDTILALTKKVVSVLVSSSAILSGSVPDDRSGQNFDIGDVHKLFVPPKTFSPKVASGTGGLLFAVLEQSELLKTALANKLSDKDYREEFLSVYGEEATNFVEEASLSKEASALDTSESIALFSKKDIMSSDWLNKEAAMQEFALNGYAISQGADTPTMSLEKISSVATRLKDITGDEALTTINGRRPGAYTVYRASDLKPMDVLVAMNLGECKSSVPSLIYGPISGYAGSSESNIENGNGIIGKQKNITDFDGLELFDKMSTKIGNSSKIVFLNGGEVYGFLSLFLSEDKISKGLGRTTISLGSGSNIETLIVDSDSDAKPVKMGNTLYIGSKNVRFVKKEDSERNAVIKVGDLDRSLGNGNMVKVANDGIEFIYKSAAYSTPALVNELLNEGFDKSSIYSLMKTAENNGSAEFSAVSAKIDMLANIVMNLAGQVQQVSAAVSQPQQGLTGVTPEEVPQLEESPQQAQEMQAQDQPLAMEDPSSGIQTQEQQAEAGQQEMAQVQSDQQMLGQQPQPQETQPDTEGMNTSIDPEVLKTLAELKDSNVMDVGIISMIASNSEISSVISQFSGDIHSGASAIGRILLNAMTKKNTMIEQVGEPKYKQMINNLKTVFVKVSDLYVDITRLQLESDGQVAN